MVEVDFILDDGISPTFNKAVVLRAYSHLQLFAPSTNLPG